MFVGIPKEIYRHEHRVGLTPYAVAQLTRQGHSVVVETDAGLTARFTDREYEEAGAKIVFSPEEAYKRADLVCRVGVIAAEELDFIKPESTLCGFLHLGVAPRATIERLRQLEVTAVGYEMIEDAAGDRPILLPMSQMAGQMAVYIAAHLLQNDCGGRGILLGPVPGIAPPTVLILGAGTVGRTAARRAVAIGTHVIVLDQDLDNLRMVSREISGQVVTQVAGPERLAQYTKIADVVIGAVAIPGGRAPFLVTEEMVKGMRAGSVVVDLSIDQGGCVETSRPTTLDHPTYVVHDVVHYCVPNMTANVARTASRALSDAVLSPVVRIATMGVAGALRDDPGMAAGVCLYRGQIVHSELASSVGESPIPLDRLLAEEAKS